MCATAFKQCPSQTFRGRTAQEPRHTVSATRREISLTSQPEAMVPPRPTGPGTPGRRPVIDGWRAERVIGIRVLWVHSWPPGVLRNLHAHDPAHAAYEMLETRRT